jgi:putative membrane protein
MRHILVTLPVAPSLRRFRSTEPDMDEHAHHADGADTLSDLILGIPFGLALIAYLAAIYLSRRRGEWPWYRSALWTVGLAACAAGVVGPLAERAHSSFAAHMVGHLSMGMLGPLLLVMSAPITLALRTLDFIWARRLVKVLASAPIRFVSHPVTAATLSLGGLWVLYSTPLFAATRHHAAVHAVVHIHILVSSYLFTAAIIGIDPNRHRMRSAYRAVVLVLFMAGHRVLAKQIFADPPLDVPIDQAHVGAMVMYYGGDILDVAIILILCYQWYATRRSRIPLQTQISPG